MHSFILLNQLLIPLKIILFQISNTLVLVFLFSNHSCNSPLLLLPSKHNLPLPTPSLIQPGPAHLKELVLKMMNKTHISNQTE